VTNSNHALPLILPNIWGWYREEGDSMFNVVNAYTRGAQYEQLTAEASFKLQKVGGMILGMVKA
jgi:hypothetical protein